ncbi:hypothetical protein CA13_05650 [Planctomycetes bacterium CA13]|uniref:Uncharacterized protein n=1 Tax=Novipirellula herctigrandis TaxID=2527986 RepID=A0A5C5YX86_9BACT|nr:hypothetical protein CA13_05650 [Planctomycetes bacterium CA13]
MHCVLLADLAAIVSQHAPALSLQRDGLNPQREMAPAIAGYWTSNRSRLELWHQVITRYRRAETVGDTLTMRQWWTRHVSVLEEILVSETLCRVVAATAKTIDLANQTEDISPITESVLNSHLEIRSRVHHLMLFGRGSSVRTAVRLNRLRQGVERWTDAMLGRMMALCPTSIDYAIDTKRAIAYAEESTDLQSAPERATASWLFNIAMHDMLLRRTTPNPSLPRSNQRVADSVLKLFPGEAFDNLGILKSRWLRQLEKNIGPQEQQPKESIIPSKHHPIAMRQKDPQNPPTSQRWYM